MKKFFVFTLLLSSVFGKETPIDRKSQELEKCLLESYRIDSLALVQILEDFSLLNEQHVTVVDAFIAESKKHDIYSGMPSFEQGPIPLPHYSILFENEYIRISRAQTKSGEQEPFQVHPWKTLMVVIHPSHFYTQKDDGTSYEDYWPTGIYFLDSSLDSMSCKNIGSCDYRGLVFEMKTKQL